MWEVSAQTTTSAPPERVWVLWEDPDRWKEWNEQIVEASAEGELHEGSLAKIRFKRSPIAMRFTVTKVDPERLFIDETRFPGARMGHEHRLECDGETTRILHRLYIQGPLEKLYVALLGRQMRASVARFGERECLLAERETATSET